MRLFLLVMFIPVFLFGFISAEVKDGDCEITLNGTTKHHKKGDVIAMQAEDKLCFIAGSGRVLIGSKIQISAKSSKCYEAPKKSDSGYLSLMVAAVTGILKSEEGSVGATARNLPGTIKISIPNSNHIKSIIIDSNDYTPVAEAVEITKNDGTNHKITSGENGLISISTALLGELKGANLIIPSLPSQPLKITFTDFCKDCNKKELIDEMIKTRNKEYKAPILGLMIE